MSGYCDCACRDCFEVAISGDEDDDGHTEPALCDECEEAGCEPGDGECLAEGAYGGDCDCSESEEGHGHGLRDEGREDFHSDG